MKRRDFIKLSLNTVLLLSLSGLVTKAEADDTIGIDKSVVVNIMLDGGPDFRHIIVPAYASDNNDENSYPAKFWKARSSIWKKSTTDELKKIYADNYDEITIDSVTFGVHKRCAWLKDEIVAGNVAIISNVIVSTNRNHHHSQVMMENGSADANAHNLDVSGWAGRAATELNAKVVSCTNEIRLICNGPHPTDPLKHDNSCVIADYNSREPGLNSYDTQADLDNDSNSYRWNERGKLDRALSSYYQLKRGTVPTSSPFYKAMTHEKQLRDFGDKLKVRLADVPIPTNIGDLMKNKSNQLDSSSFAKQILSLHDSYASQDILDMRLASLSYGGWDSHKYLLDHITPKFVDIFGATKGLASLVGALDEDAYEKSVFVIGGEFGRQLKSNGNEGNDHGRGNTMLVIGGKVKGGLYGELFPSSELDKLDVKNKDIEGLTSMFKVYAEILNWQEADLGKKVFANLDNQAVEKDVDLTTLMKED